MSTEQPTSDDRPVREYERRLTEALEAIAQPPPAASTRSSAGGTAQLVILIVFMLISVALWALAFLASRKAEQTAAATQRQLADAKLDAVPATLSNVETAAKELSTATSGFSDLAKNPQVSKLNELFANLKDAKAKLDDLGTALDGDKKREGLNERLKKLRSDIEEAGKEHLKLLKDRRDEFDATLALIPKEEGALNSRLIRTLSDINRSVETLESMAKRVERQEIVRLVTTKTSTAQTASAEVAMLLEAADTAKKRVIEKYRPTHKSFAVESWHVGNSGMIQISEKGGVPGERSILTEIKFDPPHVRYVFITHASGTANVPNQAVDTKQVIDAVIVGNIDHLQSPDSRSALLSEHYAWQNVCSQSYGEVGLVIANFEKEKEGQLRLDKKSQSLLVEAIVRLAAPRRDWPIGPGESPASVATPVKK